MSGERRRDPSAPTPRGNRLMTVLSSLRGSLLRRRSARQGMSVQRAAAPVRVGRDRGATQEFQGLGALSPPACLVRERLIRPWVVQASAVRPDGRVTSAVATPSRTSPAPPAPARASRPRCEPTSGCAQSLRVPRFGEVSSLARASDRLRTLERPPVERRHARVPTWLYPRVSQDPCTWKAAPRSHAGGCAARGWAPVGQGPICGVHLRAVFPRKRVVRARFGVGNHNPKVVGSIPTAGTRKRLRFPRETGPFPCP
jgi:hypothetical protein